MAGLTFSDLIPTADAGFGVECNKYFSGRIMAMAGKHGGLLELRFYGRQHMGGARFFEGEACSAFNKLFRLQLVIDGKAYYPEFNNTRHYPFGFRSECTFRGVRLRHELIVLEDTVAHRVTVLDNPTCLPVSARVLQHSHNFRRQDNREIRPFIVCNPEDPRLVAAITDTETKLDGDVLNATTHVTLGANRKLDIFNAHEGFKYYLNAQPLAERPGESVVFFLNFTAGDENDRTQRVLTLQTGIDAECDAKFRAYENTMATQTYVATGNPCVDSAVRNVLPAIRSLHVQGTPGAYRASQDYWVWGWDSLVHADALLYAGAADIVRDMLYFYRDFADGENGVLHAYNLRFEPTHTMPFGAQCIYVTVLYRYYVATGDKQTLVQLLPFARWIIENALKDVRADTGLTIGLGFIPDVPKLLGQTGRDLSVVNNSLFYQALRCAGVLADETGEHAFGDLCANSAAAAKKGMEKLLFDRESGYWIDSVDSDDLSPRRHFPLYAMLWVSPFAGEPGAEEFPRVRRFMRQNFPFSEGLYYYPPMDPCFMADGNQFGAYYPCIDRYYWNLANRAADSVEAEQLKHIIAHFWQEHTYPEGLTHETENADPTTDNPGCKQAFAAKAWYCDVLELLLGLSSDSRGVTVNPLSDSGELHVDSLVLREKRFSLTLRGAGESVEILLNGHQVKGTRKFAWDCLSEINTLEIRRYSGPRELCIVRGDEVRIHVEQATKQELEVTAECAQTGLLWIQSPSELKLTVDGASAGGTYFREYGQTLLWLKKGTHRVHASCC